MNGVPKTPAAAHLFNMNPENAKGEGAVTQLPSGKITILI